MSSIDDGPPVPGGRPPRPTLVALVLSGIGAVSTALELWRSRFLAGVASGWVLPILVVVVLAAFLLRRARRAPTRPAGAVLFLVGAVLVAQVLLRSGVAWQPGLARWAIVMTPIALCSLWLDSRRMRSAFAAPVSVRRRWVLGAIVVMAVPALLIAVGHVSAEVVRVAATTFQDDVDPVSGGDAVVRSPESRTSTRFPREHSRCSGTLDRSTPAPAGVDPDVWTSVLLEAAYRTVWRLCHVAPVHHGPDGMVDVRVFSAVAGPEGHILARRMPDGSVATAFVEPQAGQLYFQQPGGEPLVHWGMPDAHQPDCGRGRLVIFRRSDGSISGISRWSKPIEPGTRGTLSAYFIPADILLPLLSVLEADDRALPLAVGPVTERAGTPKAQYFEDGLFIAVTHPLQGEVTEARVLARCR